MEGEQEEERREERREEHEEDVSAQEGPSRKRTKKGPTSRSHASLQQVIDDVWIPSSDEESNPGDLNVDDDDQAVPLPFVVQGGRGTRAKKMKPMVWYDEKRANPEEQFSEKLCFVDVYQFRRALLTFHITHNRNYGFHRNCSDNIIAVCTSDDCPFYLTASKIANDTTFAIRKAFLVHRCPAVPEDTKATAKWVAHKCEEIIRTDLKTPISTIMKTFKTKYGVDISTHMAYRGKNASIKVVQGDQRGQYIRIRDYLQDVMDTNRGSRCIVTTKFLEEHPSTNPRFHGLFICLNACKEGFLSGCRPFIGTIH